MVDPRDYSDNKAFELLTKKQREQFIHMMNWRLERIISLKGGKAKTLFPNEIEKLNTEMQTINEVFGVMGIQIAYNWSGHRRTHFFPTYNDALEEEDWQWQCAE